MRVKPVAFLRKMVIMTLHLLGRGDEQRVHPLGASGKLDARGRLHAGPGSGPGFYRLRSVDRARLLGQPGAGSPLWRGGECKPHTRSHRPIMLHCDAYFLTSRTVPPAVKSPPCGKLVPEFRLPLVWGYYNGRRRIAKAGCLWNPSAGPVVPPGRSPPKAAAGTFSCPTATAHPEAETPEARRRRVRRKPYSGHGSVL